MSPLFIPSPLEIRCPRCSRPALFEAAFDYVLSRRKDAGLPPELREADPERVHRWGGWYVLEKYPSVVPWRAPAKNERLGPPRGIVKCPHCHLLAAHDLRWPDDAYYRWDIRGHTLWARNREHAEVLLGFISSKERDERRYPGYERSLSRLPGEFIGAKVRDDIVRAISRSLEVDQG